MSPAPLMQTGQGPRASSQWGGGLGPDPTLKPTLPSSHHLFPRAMHLPNWDVDASSTQHFPASDSGSLALQLPSYQPNDSPFNDLITRSKSPFPPRAQSFALPSFLPWRPPLLPLFTPSVLVPPLWLVGTLPLPRGLSWSSN